MNPWEVFHKLVEKHRRCNDGAGSTKIAPVIPKNGHAEHAAERSRDTGRKIRVAEQEIRQGHQVELERSMHERGVLESLPTVKQP